MRICLSGSKVAIKSFVFSIGLVAEKQQFCATRLSDFHELSRAASPWGQLWQFWQSWQLYWFAANQVLLFARSQKLVARSCLYSTSRQFRPEHASASSGTFRA